MHIKSCFDPQRVRDVVTKELRLVPCGKCPACKNNVSSIWVQRLDQERYSWKYAFFFTLTYAPEHLPMLQVFDDFATACTPELSAPDQPPIVIPYQDIFDKYVESEDDKLRFIGWLKRQNKIGVVSSYHASKFIKRFRTYANREYQKPNNKLLRSENNTPFFRYWIIGEYGSTSLRPHYHGLLFFNSEFLASHAAELLSKCWKFGIVDSSFVSDTNSSYVASYLNSLSDIPAIYRYRKIRPFFLCSKFPPIGTLSYSSDAAKAAFFDGDIKFAIFDHSKGLFDNVPLWRTFKNKFYPRLSGFNQLTHFERVALYRYAEKYTSFAYFYDTALGKYGYIPAYVSDYVDYLTKNCTNFPVAMQRWFYTSRRVVVQSKSFDLSVSDYVTYIENFYKKCDYENLKSMYKFQQDYQDDGHPLSDLIAVDELFIRGFIGIDVSNVSVEDIDRLKSYGIDVDKFFSDDDIERTTYQESLLPESTYDYKTFSIDSWHWQHKRIKNKKKNDYLELHPELQNIIY